MLLPHLLDRGRGLSRRLLLQLSALFLAAPLLPRRYRRRGRPPTGWFGHC